MKSPAFQFYPSDWLGSQRVQMLTLEEEGGYIRLIAYCWQHGSIPSDPEKVAKLIGKGASTTLATTLLSMFQPSSDESRMVHDRLEEERAKQEVWRQKSSEGGKKSAEMRHRSKGGSTTVPRVVDECLPNGSNQTSTLPLPSSSSSTHIQPEAHYPECNGYPTEQEAVDSGAMVGLVEWKCRQWHREMQSVGWVDYKGRKVVDWRAMLANVKAKWDADGRPMTHPGRVHPKSKSSAEFNYDGNL